MNDLRAVHSLTVGSHLLSGAKGDSLLSNVDFFAGAADQKSLQQTLEVCKQLSRPGFEASQAQLPKPTLKPTIKRQRLQSSRLSRLPKSKEPSLGAGPPLQLKEKKLVITSQSSDYEVQGGQS